jgi:hypothetical protein
VAAFKPSILPEIFLSPCGYALPFVEGAGGREPLGHDHRGIRLDNDGALPRHRRQLIHASLLAALLTFRRHQWDCQWGLPPRNLIADRDRFDHISSLDAIDYLVLCGLCQTRR